MIVLMFCDSQSKRKFLPEMDGALGSILIYQTAQGLISHPSFKKLWIMNINTLKTYCWQHANQLHKKKKNDYQPMWRDQEQNK